MIYFAGLVQGQHKLYISKLYPAVEIKKDQC